MLLTNQCNISSKNWLARQLVGGGGGGGGLRGEGYGHVGTRDMLMNSRTCRYICCRSNPFLG